MVESTRERVNAKSEFNLKTNLCVFSRIVELYLEQRIVGVANDSEIVICGHYETTVRVVTAISVITVDRNIRFICHCQSSAHSAAISILEGFKTSRVATRKVLQLKNENSSKKYNFFKLKKYDCSSKIGTHIFIHFSAFDLLSAIIGRYINFFCKEIKRNIEYVNRILILNKIRNSVLIINYIYILITCRKLFYTFVWLVPMVDTLFYSVGKAGSVTIKGQLCILKFQIKVIKMSEFTTSWPMKL